MAGGNWSPTEGKVRPGFYLNFEAAALAAIQPGARGVVACPVKANWGPVGAFPASPITSEAELLEIYGLDSATGATAYRTIFMALLGGAQKVLPFRLSNGSHAKASITLKDTTAESAVSVLKLETIYETTRDFRVTVRANILDGDRQDIVLYEGTKALCTFEKGATGVDNAVEAINGDTRNKWIKATKVADGNGILAAVTSSAFSGGNNGIAGITNEEYIEAQEAFETRKFNFFTLDGMTDSALQTSFASWIERQRRDEGIGVVGVLGGTAENDEDPTAGNARSRAFNYEGVVNVITGCELDGVKYSSAEVAPYIAGLIAGKRLDESITYSVTPFDDIIPRLTHSQIEAALLAGSLVLVHDGEKTKIESGVNTLTSLRAKQNNQWKKIRAIRTMDALNDDMLKTASDAYIGKVNNNEDGKIALITAFKRYMEIMVKGGVIEKDFTVYLDPDYHGNPPLAAPDEVYPVWEAYITDSMEKIFGRFMVK